MPDALRKKGTRENRKFLRFKMKKNNLRENEFLKVFSPTKVFRPACEQEELPAQRQVRGGDR